MRRISRQTSQSFVAHVLLKSRPHKKVPNVQNPIIPHGILMMHVVGLRIEKIVARMTFACTQEGHGKPEICRVWMCIQEHWTRSNWSDIAQNELNRMGISCCHGTWRFKPVMNFVNCLIKPRFVHAVMCPVEEEFGCHHVTRNEWKFSFPMPWL